MVVTARTSLDAQKLRADFPIFEQEIHGKPLAYLDSAVTSQKPRQVLDAMRDFYETSNANVHRGVYTLSERATEAFEGARQKRLISFAAGDFAKEIDVTKVGRESKIQSVANCFSIPCKRQTRRRVAKVRAMRR